jgi:hypothetical protein
VQVDLSTYIFTSPMKTLFSTFSFSVPTTVNLMMIIRLKFEILSVRRCIVVGKRSSVRYVQKRTHRIGKAFPCISFN